MVVVTGGNQSNLAIAPIPELPEKITKENKGESETSESELAYVPRVNNERPLE